MSVLAHQDAANIVARQGRFQLAQLVGVEFVDFDPILAAQFPGEPVLFRPLRRTIDVEVAEAMDEFLGARVADQRRQRASVAPTSGRNARAWAWIFSGVPARIKRTSHGAIIGR